MNKKEFFESLWIPLNQRLPPETDEKVLYWNPEYEQAGEAMGRLVCIWHEQMKDPAFVKKINADPVKKILNGYGSTHWMPRWGPKVKKRRRTK